LTITDVHWYGGVSYLTTCRYAGTGCASFIVSSIFIVGLIGQKVTPKLKSVQCKTTHGGDNPVRTNN